MSSSYCFIHGGFYHDACPHCVAAGITGSAFPNCAPQPDATRLRLNVQSRTIDFLLRQQAALIDEVVALRRRINAMAQDTIDRQRSHNALASGQDLLEQRLNLQGETLSSLGRRQDMLDGQAQRRDVRISAIETTVASLEERVEQAEDDS